MIPKEIIKKIRRIHIKSSRTVNTLMAGQYRSVFKGSGIEFEEVREYSPGDDIKSIDWKVSARLGRPFIKLYREERESIVMLLIDMSRSQVFGTFSGSKLEKAAEIASVLAFSAIKNNDKVGAVFFTDRVEKYIPPKKGSGHVWRLIKELFTFSPQGRGTDLALALDFLGRVSRKKSILFLLSDFLTGETWAKNLTTAARRHELIGVVLHDRGEFHLPGKGIVATRCLETGETVVLDAYSKKVRDAYAGKRKQHYRQIQETFNRAGVDFMEIGTHMAVSDVLTKFFRCREKRMR